jgi:ABC-type ATPase involved in cell division
MWILGALGLVPGADKYALLFGAWVGLTELIPYLGPWLGAIPAAIYAVVVDPISILWVAGLFLIIHQVEGHIVVPNVMGSALRLHPLLVIFGLLAGGEIYGLAGSWSRCRCSPPPGPRMSSSANASSWSRGGWPRRSDVRWRSSRSRRPSHLYRYRSRRRRPRWRNRGAASAGPAVDLPPAARGVGRRYGDHVALEATDVEVRGGEVLALVGPNGAGKSTLLGILAGALPPSEGRSRSGGRAGRLDAATPRPLRPPLRPSEPGAFRAAPGRRRRGRPARAPRAADRRRPASTLSVGNRQRLDLAISLLGDPQVLLLDEPTAALDPRQRRRLWETAQGVRDAGGAVVLVTQNVEGPRARRRPRRDAARRPGRVRRAGRGLPAL